MAWEMNGEFSLKRLIVVMICYGLSVGGGAAWLMFASAALESFTIAKALFPPLFIYALACHVMMSFGWIFGTKVGGFLTQSGVAAWIVSLLLIPVIGIVSSPSSAEGSIRFLFLGLVAFAPCLILGIVLVSCQGAELPGEEETDIG
jgi:hypothetical protein